MNVRERYRPQLMGVDATYAIRGQQVGGFLCATTGTITITDADGTSLVSAHPVTAGQYVPLPFVFATAQGATVTLAGGASGTLAV